MEEINAWLARDKDGELVFYLDGKPRKSGKVWLPGRIVGRSIALDPNLFPEVQWSDEEPTKVKLVIEK